MAAGFRCADGVVLCADREITGPYTKYKGTKIRMYGRYKLHCQPVFAFAGDVNFCGMLMRKIAHGIAQTEAANKPIVPAIETAVLNLHKKFEGEDCDKESALILAVMLGTGTNKRRVLYEIQRGIVDQVPPDYPSCIGSGEPITRAMIQELFDPSLHVRQVALIAAYLLAEAKTYGLGVGKDSYIILLFDSGSLAVFPDDPFYSSLQQIEDDYMQLKQFLGPVMRAFSNLKVNEEEFSKILNDFRGYVESHRKARLSAYEKLLQEEAIRQAEMLEDYIGQPSNPNEE